MSEAWKTLIAAGGTGGHISPALAIAEHLVNVDPSCCVQFVCGRRPVELEIYKRAGVAPTTMNVVPLRRGPIGWLANIRNLSRSLAAARAHLANEKPDVVVGMGGYVCVPVVQAAAMKKIPTLIHEQNSVAGRANRWLSRRVRTIACAYPQAARAFPPSKTRVTGNPVRPTVVGCDREAGLREWNLEDGVPTVLLFGGSQGARRLNEIMLEALPRFAAATGGPAGLQLLWACGDANHADLEKKIKTVTDNSPHLIRLIPYIEKMGLAYAATDLAIGRAGAMTLAELTANALPAIIVPLPGATGGHQELNAQPLADAGALIIEKECDLTGPKLAEIVTMLLKDKDRLSEMRKCSKKVAKPNAIGEITKIILELRGELP